MAATRKLARTRDIAIEKKQNEQTTLPVDGARLPLFGVLLVVAGIVLAVAGVCLVMGQVSKPEPNMKTWLGGLGGAVIGLVLIFGSFGKWSKI